MLKRAITYTDFNDNEVIEEFYFHLSKSEILKLQVSVEGGLQEMFMKIVAAEDFKNLFSEFEKIVVLAYGKKSDDGKKFIKSDELRDEFKSTAAFDALLMELLTDETAAADFVNGMIPKDLAARLKEQDKPVGPPLPPAVKP
jgi:hypothetical protein